jgi:hypothetical protein
MSDVLQEPQPWRRSERTGALRTKLLNDRPISACSISACLGCCSPGVVGRCCNCGPVMRRRVGYINYLYGLWVHEAFRVRYHTCNYSGGQVPMNVPVAAARSIQPAPPAAPRALVRTLPDTSEPNVASSTGCRDSGRSVPYLFSGCGSSPAGDQPQLDSHCSPCRAALCCVLLTAVWVCRKCRVGPIHWSPSGPPFPNGLAVGPPVADVASSTVGVGVFVSLFCCLRHFPFSGVLGKQKMRSYPCTLGKIK